MDTFKLTVSRYPRISKPSNMKDVWYDLSNTITPELTFEELVAFIGENNHPFCHGDFDGDIRYNNFSSSQMIVLDIDNKEQVFHPTQALDRLHQLGLDCNIIYVTFNDPTDPTLPDEEMLEVVERYRMVFILKNPIKNLQIFLGILEQLYSIFPEADRCHGAQIWIGGNRLIYKNPDYRLLPMDLIHLLHVQETKNIKSKRKIEKFKEKIAALPDEAFQQEDDEPEEINVPKNASCNTLQLQPVKNGTSPVRNFNWEAARGQCKLLDDFLGAKRKIMHYELYGLYTAMKRIEGGKKLWRKSVKQNPEINDEKLFTIGGWMDNWEERGNVRYEKPLRYYAPKDDPARTKYYRLTDIHFGRQREARQIREHYHIPLQDAEWAFRYMFHQVKSEIGNGVYVFKCATGLGKTQELTHVKLDECVIAVPNHRLKNELSARMTAAGIKHITIADLPPGLPDVIREKYASYLAIGSFNYANGYLRSLNTDRLINMGLPIEEAKSLGIQLQRYFNKIDLAVENTYPVITTHKRIAHTDFPNHSTIIFDEDVIKTIGEAKTVSLKDIRISRNHIDGDALLHRVLTQILELSNDPASIGIPISRDQILSGIGIAPVSIDREMIEELLDSGVRSEIISLLEAEVMIIIPQDYKDPDGEKSIQFIVRNDPPQDMKIIIMSATANEFIYRQLFKNVEFFDLSVVEMQGTATQYSNRGFSRASWSGENSQQVLRQISDHIGLAPTITYKSEKYQRMFKNPFLHFENVAGTDELKGQDIAVVGTPNKPRYYYLLWASFLGIEYDPEKVDLIELPVEANGFEFNFMTFEDPELRKIQFHFIEDTLVQAVGRARLIRTDAQVEVYCRYPLIGFTQLNTREITDSKQDAFSVDINALKRKFEIYPMPISGSMAS